MTYKITHKNSTVSGTPPTAGDIDVGEIAINAADAELYTKDANGNIKKFANTDTTGTAVGVQFTQAGTGAVTRTAESKLRDVVSVKDFGAVGDGVTNDTAAIQAALASNPGTLYFEPNKSFKVTSNLIIPQGTVIDGQGSTILINRVDATNTDQILVGADCSITNLNLHLPTGASCQRMLTLGANCSIDNMRISSVDQIAQGDDNLDGIVQIRGNNVSISRINFSNFDKPIIAYQADNVRITGFSITSFVRGITLRESTNITISDGVIKTPSPNASTSAGHNAIGGDDSSKITISNLLIQNTGEHGIYLSNSAYLTTRIGPVMITGVTIDGPGQCGIKLRGYRDITVSGVTVVDCAYNNTTGTNEDGFRFEYCVDVSLSGASVFTKNKASSCYCGLYLNNVIALTVQGLFVDAPTYSAVCVEDTNGAAVTRAFVSNLQCVSAPYAIYVSTSTYSVSDFIVTGLVSRSTTTKTVYWNAAGGVAGVNFIQGYECGSTITPGAYVEIVAGTLEYTIQEGSARNLINSFTNTGFEQGSAFTAGDGTPNQKGALFITAYNAVAGTNNYNGGIAFSGPNTERRRAAIACYQPTSDPDQAGLVFLTRSSATTGNNIINPVFYIDHLGNPIFQPQASVTPANNGQLMIQATSNTSLTFKFKGSDGVVRSGSITLT